MAKASNHFIVILCGGTGPRLWPMSRANFPKQFLTITGNHSLLQQTIIRAKKIVPADHVFLISNSKYIATLKKQVSTLLNFNNCLVEPEKKNTLAATIYASSIINHLYPDPIITTLPSDHYIGNTTRFTNCIKKTVEIAKKLPKIVTIGIKPTFPNPSYGYILKDNSFIEKPDTKKATLLIKQKALWNSGVYTFSYSTLLKELSLHQRSIFQLSKLVQNHPSSITSVKNFYHQIPSLSIDVAISEKTKNLVSTIANFSWSDVGEWKTISHLLKRPSQQHAKLFKDTNFVDYNSSGCLISAPGHKLVGLVGVKNLAIIDTQDGLLICNLEDSYNVRDLVSKIVSKKSTENYFLKTNEST